MSRWILAPSLFTLLVLASAAACGGNVLRVGNDLGDGGNQGGGPDAPVPIALPDGALPPGVVAAIPFPSSKIDSFRRIVGTSASDLWCLGAGDGTRRGNTRLQLLHWDGAAWSVVNLPAPLGYGTFEVSAASPVAPGVVWVASAMGVARMHTDGTAESFNAPGFDGAGVASRVAVAHVGIVTYLSRDDRVFFLDGTKFRDLTDPGMQPIEGIDGPGDAVWIWGANGLVARGSGLQWTPSYPFGGSTWSVHTFSEGKFWGIPGPEISSYVGHLTSTRTQPWHLWSVDAASVVGQLEVDPPADVSHDGTATYQGTSVLTNAAGKLAFVACASSAQDGPPHLVVHEWNGSTLGPARSLPDSLGCATATHPLTDGTWVFLRGGEHDSVPDTFVLVSP